MFETESIHFYKLCEMLKHMVNLLRRLGQAGGVLLLASVLTASANAGITVTPEEMAQKNQWVQQNLLNATNLPPFSFIYHSQPSSTLLPSWVRSESDTILDTNRTQHVLTWTKAGIGLQVECVVIEYADYPEVEWTVFLTNAGAIDTPVVQNIQGLDTIFSRTNGSEFVLNGNQGDSDTAASYEPFQITLNSSSVNTFSPPSYSGKSCDGNGWPYYNLQLPGGGVILAIGWPGQWACSFTRDAASGLRIQAGQQLTHLYLTPGEEVRTPLIAMLFWQGTNVVRAQNIWRRWYLAHEIPRVNGQPPATILQVQGDSSNVVNSYLQAGIQPEVLWRDAGWYPEYGPYTGDLAWLNTGTWEVDTNQYPNGFGMTSTQVHALGVKFLLWFEPERVGNTNSSFLATNNPAWLLPATSTTVGDILNEGNPAVFNWLTNHFETLIKSNGVDWYREDMNGGGPLSAWQNNDAANRQGITENFYVQGHLAYWDALLAMNPGLRIDCCGSGGRRNDLEAMRRAVPLTRSDFLTGDAGSVPDGNQCQTYGLSSWLPFQGAGSYFNDPYSFRSFYMASFTMIYTPDQQQAFTEFGTVAPLMLNGDYYPLTPYSLADNVWMAWQFDRPDTGEGCVQIFRRTNSPVASMNVQLQGLEPGKLYQVRDFDRGDLGKYTGNQLMSTGLAIQLNPRQSAVIYYTNTQGVALSAAGCPSIGLQPLSVQFSASGVAASEADVTYAWAFGDGGTTTNQNPVHTYGTGGRYLATVTASDGLGNTNVKQVPITVIGANGREMKITFAGYSSSETLTNFPALVVFGTNLTGNGFSYSQMASTNGWDLVFLNSDQTQPLNYEIEKWDTNGSSYVWVQVPQLTNNASIWVIWGDAALASVPQPSMTNGTVWGNGYAGVWHLANGTFLSGQDSTVNGYNGAVNNAVATNGMIDGAAWFNGANAYLDLGTAENPLSNQQLTMSAWVFPKGGTVIMMKGNDATSASYGLEWLGNTTLLFTFGSTTDWLSDGGSTPPNQWSHITGIINGNNKYLYVNGLLKASDTFSGTLSASALSLWLGAQNRPAYNYWFNGALDEVRMSSLARSANWVWAEYQNMSANSVFNNYGPVSLYAPPISLVHLSISGNRNNVVISWPTNIVAGVVLQTSQDLLTWTNATEPGVISGTNSTISITPQYTVEYYRLTY
jgi:alpha-galactosidase